MRELRFRPVRRWPEGEDRDAPACAAHGTAKRPLHDPAAPGYDAGLAGEVSMLKQSVARRRIIDAWILWPERPARPTDKHFRRFHDWLARHRPELLAFRAAGEKWRVIRDWLLEIEPGS